MTATDQTTINATWFAMNIPCAMDDSCDRPAAWRMWKACGCTHCLCRPCRVAFEEHRAAMAAAGTTRAVCPGCKTTLGLVGTVTWAAL